MWARKLIRNLGIGLIYIYLSVVNLVLGKPSPSRAEISDDPKLTPTGTAVSFVTLLIAVLYKYHSL